MSDAEQQVGVNEFVEVASSHSVWLDSTFGAGHNFEQEIAPTVFCQADDGLPRIHFGPILAASTPHNGKENGTDSLRPLLAHELDATITATKQQPDESIFLEVIEENVSVAGLWAGFFKRSLAQHLRTIYRPEPTQGNDVPFLSLREASNGAALMIDAKPIDVHEQPKPHYFGPVIARVDVLELLDITMSSDDRHHLANVVHYAVRGVDSVDALRLLERIEAC